MLSGTNVLCKRAKICAGYGNCIAGKDWWEGVKRRHHVLTSIITPERRTIFRARMTNHDVIGKTYTYLATIVEVRSLSNKLQCLWKCDEMGKSFLKTVINKKGMPCVAHTSSRSSNVTVIACVNAQGKHAALFTVKGKTSKSL